MRNFDAIILVRLLEESLCCLARTSLASKSLFPKDGKIDRIITFYNEQRRASQAVRFYNDLTREQPERALKNHLLWAGNAQPHSQRVRFFLENLQLLQCCISIHFGMTRPICRDFKPNFFRFFSSHFKRDDCDFRVSNLSIKHDDKIKFGNQSTQ